MGAKRGVAKQLMERVYSQSIQAEHSSLQASSTAAASSHKSPSIFCRNSSIVLRLSSSSALNNGSIKYYLRLSPTKRANAEARELTEPGNGVASRVSDEIRIDKLPQELLAILLQEVLLTCTNDCGDALLIVIPPQVANTHTHTLALSFLMVKGFYGIGFDDRRPRHSKQSPRSTRKLSTVGS